MNLDFLSLKESVQSIGNRVSQLRTDIEQKKRRREEIAAAPLAREDVVLMVDDLLRRAKEEYPQRLAESFAQRIMRCNVELPKDITALRQRLDTNLIGIHNHATQLQPEAVDLEFGLCALLGETIRGPLVKVIEEMPWPADPGLPMAERFAELARLDAEVINLEKELRTIEREAEAAGVRF